MRITGIILSLSVLIALILTGCRSQRGFVSQASRETPYHHFYDDTSLAVDNRSILMPYNRVLDPAGIVIRFGNPTQENHSLDCVLLPEENTLVVEDRFGVAFIDVTNNKLIHHLNYDGNYKGYVSTYSGIKTWKDGANYHVYWGAVSNEKTKTSYVMEAVWNGATAKIADAIRFEARAPGPISIANDIFINREANEDYLYVVLNGNDQLVKIRRSDKKVIWTVSTGMSPFGVVVAGSKVYVTNWAGATPADTAQSTAGVPYGKVYADPRTGATASGTVSVFDIGSGARITDIETGLHPGAIICSADKRTLYVANANSDNISVINTATDKVVATITVNLNTEFAGLVGDSPNGLALDDATGTLYVSNGMDNAICVVKLGSTPVVKGFIPTEAYPAGLVFNNGKLYVCNLEGEGARIKTDKGFTIHQQQATVSVIAVPDQQQLDEYTTRVNNANLLFRTKLNALLPRKNVAPKPVPDRIGEPSVFKHVVYIIKENKTYDQVMGDIPEGNGMASLCIFGKNVTPNEHQLVKDYLLMDNYYASGKSSAEGHSWTDAAITTDYIEKNIGAWFRSYPHVLADALAYNKNGFIWNNALDHGKTVRIYGEACSPRYNTAMSWSDIYNLYTSKKPFVFTNTTTISRVEPVLSPTYPCYEGVHINDQLRADAFIKELHDFEKMEGDQFPQLVVMALPADHTSGTREGFPTPAAMVADNDLALGRIIEALTASRFWDSTVVFITEDDSQSGWDHVSPYRTVGMVISPYSKLQKTVHTNFNQTCMVRTMEQILGIPPMNVIDATARPMFECFNNQFVKTPYLHLANNIPLNEMNKSAALLQGKAKSYAIASGQFTQIDTGNDDLLNRILWFAAKGAIPYPKKMTLPKREQKDDDDD